MNIKSKPIKVLFFLIGIAICASINAQNNVPLGLKYQAVARDDKGKPMAQRDIVVKMQIVQMDKGALIWEELHYISTNGFGLFQLTIGEGFTTGEGLVLDFESINWGEASLALQVKLDFGIGFLDMGITKLQSVPYAFLADSALKAPLPDMGLGQLENVSSQKPTKNQPLVWNGKEWLPGDSLKVKNLLTQGALKIGDSGLINGVTGDSNLTDASDQTIPTSKAVKSYVAGLATSGGINTDNQELTLNGTLLEIQRGNNVDLSPIQDGTEDADADPSNELQDLSLSGTDLSISNGNTVNLGNLPDEVNDSDPDPLNEIQDLLLNNNILTITNNSSATPINLTPYQGTNTDNQELSLSDTYLSISGGNTVDLSSMPGYVDDLDPDPANELQNISLTGTNLTISNGNTIDLSVIDTDTRLTEPEVDAFVENNGYLSTESDPIFTGHPASSITTQNITSWNTAFGWGDHADAGYLTSYTETDPIFSASPAADITTNDLNNWNNNVNYWNLNGSNLYVLNRQVGIGTSSPAASLHVANNDVVFTAPYSLPGTSDAPPVSGQGTRMMWYPDKAAFRFGRVQGTNWNMENIGNYSFAGGDNPLASGLNSIALGRYSEAIGDHSVALAGGVANASNSIAIGGSARVHSEATGSAAIGADANVYGVWATALGFQTEARGNYSTVMGLNTKTSGGGYGATAMGAGSEAIGHGSTAMGDDALASGETSTAMGNNTIASGDNSFAANMYTTSQSFSSTVIGRYNLISGNTASWIDNDPLFIIGNGSSSTNRNNAVTVYKNGNMVVDGNITANRFYGDGSGLTGIGGTQCLIWDPSLRRLSISGCTGYVTILDYWEADTDDQTLRQVLSYGNSAGSYRIINLADPINNQDAATKKYVDDEIDDLNIHYHDFDVDQRILDLEDLVNSLEARISNLESGGNGGSGTVTDRDGNVYHTVTIGSQVWMGENLRTTRFNNGSSIPFVSGGTAWSNLTTPAYCWPNGSSSNAQPYGACYNWYVIDQGNVCPSGWHVPTHAEWLELMNYLGGETVAGGKLKETGESHWNSPNSSYATDDYGFSAVGAGGRRNTGVYESFQEYADFWTPDIYEGTGPIWWIFFYNSTSIEARGPGNRNYGTSIRCIKD